MMDKFIQLSSFLMISVTANKCWRRLSGEIKSMIFVRYVGCWINLGKTGQWMKPERITVSLLITGVCSGLSGFAASSRALAMGGDPTPPL